MNRCWDHWVLHRQVQLPAEIRGEINAVAKQSFGRDAEETASK
jgi:hypothetical protein